MKFGACCFFLVLWTTLVYDPIVHWIWGVGGFLRLSGVIDFAGGVPVQLAAGMTALVIGLSLGRRRGTAAPNTSLASWGVFLLWLTWSGMVAGSALSAGGLAANSLAVIDASAAAAALTWGVLDAVLGKRPSPLGMMAGLIAGLAASVPAAGYITVWGGLFTGIGAAAVSYSSLVYAKKKWGSDPAFDIFALHGMGGVWGLIAVGSCASPDVHPSGVAGLLYGNRTLIAIQIKAALATTIYTFIVSTALLFVVDRLVGLVRRTGEPLEKTAS